MGTASLWHRDRKRKIIEVLWGFSLELSGCFLTFSPNSKGIIHESWWIQHIKGTDECVKFGAVRLNLKGETLLSGSSFKSIVIISISAYIHVSLPLLSTHVHVHPYARAQDTHRTQGWSWHSLNNVTRSKNLQEKSKIHFQEIELHFLTFYILNINLPALFKMNQPVYRACGSLYSDHVFL